MSRQYGLHRDLAQQPDDFFGFQATGSRIGQRGSGRIRQRERALAQDSPAVAFLTDIDQMKIEGETASGEQRFALAQGLHPITERHQRLAAKS